MNIRSFLIGFISGAALIVIIMGFFFSFKTTRNVKDGFYTLNLNGKENVYIQNPDETKLAHINSWGTKEEKYDEITSYRVAPNQDTYYFNLMLTPRGLKASLSTTVSGIDSMFLDENGDGVFDVLSRSGDFFDITYNYTPKEMVEQGTGEELLPRSASQ